MGYRAFLLILLSPLTGTARADVIYSDFGPGDRYGSTAWVIGQDPLLCCFREAGNSFTPTSGTFTLDRIEVAAIHLHGANILDVWLMDDAAGRPGKIIESIHLLNQLPVDHAGVVAANSSLHPLLAQGTPYWVVLSTASTSELYWVENSTNDLGLASRLNAGPWVLHPDYVRGVFRVSGSPVPEPGAFILLGLGILHLLCCGWWGLPKGTDVFVSRPESL
jgi:hypothetical protein